MLPRLTKSLLTLFLLIGCLSVYGQASHTVYVTADRQKPLLDTAFYHFVLSKIRADSRFQSISKLECPIKCVLFTSADGKVEDLELGQPLAPDLEAALKQIVRQAAPLPVFTYLNQPVASIRLFTLSPNPQAPCTVTEQMPEIAGGIVPILRSLRPFRGRLKREVKDGMLLLDMSFNAKGQVQFIRPVNPITSKLSRDIEQSIMATINQNGFPGKIFGRAYACRVTHSISLANIH